MLSKRAEKVIRRVGERVRALRKERGYTVKDLAKRANISPRFYAQLEAGQANIAIGRLALVADALQVSLEALVAEDQRPTAVALLGLRGGGKSTMGPRLAEALQLEFVELDARIEDEAGLSLTEIFSLHGEDYYRRLETQCLHQLLDSESPAVIALSGGVVHNSDAFERIQRDCSTIWLKANPEDHMQRVIDQGDHRPVADRENAMADLRTLLAQREPLYRQAQITVDTSDLNVDAALSSIAPALTDAGWVYQL
jgi:XRE family aerobic/anaerobic benzoate catabolism transcriptional regulator